MVLGTGKCLGWLYPVLLFLLVAQTYTVDLAPFQPLKSQHNPSRLVLRLHCCPTTFLNSNLPSPTTHPMKTLLILPLTSSQPTSSNKQTDILTKVLHRKENSNTKFKRWLILSIYSMQSFLMTVLDYPTDGQKCYALYNFEIAS